MKNFLLALIPLLIMIPAGYCDTWNYPGEVEKTVYNFGETKIVRIVDSTKNTKIPDFIIDIYKKDELVAKYRGVTFEHIAASNDNKTFVGISNDGLPGTSLIVFTSEGTLTVWAKHYQLPFHYCEESVTRVRQWFDDNNPNLHFIYEEDESIKDISVNGCDSKEIRLFKHIADLWNLHRKRPDLD